MILIYFATLISILDNCAEIFFLIFLHFRKYLQKQLI